ELTAPATNVEHRSVRREQRQVALRSRSDNGSRVTTEPTLKAEIVKSGGGGGRGRRTRWGHGGALAAEFGPAPPPFANRGGSRASQPTPALKRVHAIAQLADALASPIDPRGGSDGLPQVVEHALEASQL